MNIGIRLGINTGKGNSIDAMILEFDHPADCEDSCDGLIS